MAVPYRVDFPNLSPQLYAARPGRLAGVDAGGPLRPRALARADGGGRAHGASAGRARGRPAAGDARATSSASGSASRWARCSSRRSIRTSAVERVPQPGLRAAMSELGPVGPAAARGLPRAARDGARHRLAALPARTDRRRLAPGRHHEALGRRVKVLFLVTRLPVPPWRGDQVRAYHHLRQLAPRHDITCCALVTRPPPDALRAAVEALGVRLEVVTLGALGAAPALARALLGDPRPLQVLLYLRAGRAPAGGGAAAGRTLRRGARAARAHGPVSSRGRRHAGRARPDRRAVGEPGGARAARARTDGAGGGMGGVAAGARSSVRSSRGRRVRSSCRRASATRWAAASASPSWRTASTPTPSPSGTDRGPRRASCSRATSATSRTSMRRAGWSPTSSRGSARRCRRPSSTWSARDPRAPCGRSPARRACRSPPRCPTWRPSWRRRRSRSFPCGQGRGCRTRCSRRWRSGRRWWRRRRWRPRWT